MPETSVRNYYQSLRNNPEERSTLLLYCGSLKSRAAFLSDKFGLLVLVIIRGCVLKPPWRNRLARSAVNRKVGGSSPPGGGVNFFFFKYQQVVITEKPGLLRIFIIQGYSK